ncbi:MAG: hypothetical protein ABI682_15205, partial [Acidobacteriota bacterium]
RSGSKSLSKMISEKKFVFAAAFAASLLPFAVPVIRGLAGTAANEARQFTALILGGTFVAALVALFGGSTLAGELSARRLSFYFSRPIPAVSLWTGKICGAAAVVLVASAILFVPTFRFSGPSGPLRELASGTTTGQVLLALPVLLLLLLASNAAGIALRSRSALAAVDLVLLAGLGVLVARFAEALVRVSVDRTQAAQWCAVGILFLALSGFAAAAHRATARGRTDLQTAHRALSSTLWAILGTGVLGFAAYSGWALGTPPSALTSFDDGEFVGSSGWVNVLGQGRGVLRRFLFDSVSGRYFATPPATNPYAPSLVAASRDGRVAARFDLPGRDLAFTLALFRLDRPGERPVETRVTSRQPISLALSPDGSRGASLGEGLLSVFELPRGHSLGSLRMAAKGVEAVYFAGPDIVRVLRVIPAAPEGPAAGSRLEISEYDLRTRRLVVSGPTETLQLPFIRVSPSADRLLIRERGGSRVTLRDGRTAALTATLREGPLAGGHASGWTLPVFLADGGTALGSRAFDQPAVVDSYSASGAFRRRITLPAAGTVRFGLELAPGKLLVALGTKRPGSHESVPVLYRVDVERGEVARLAEGLWPVTAPLAWPQPTSVEPGSEATKLFWRKAALVRFDPATGQSRTLLGRSTP